MEQGGGRGHDERLDHPRADARVRAESEGDERTGLEVLVARCAVAVDVEAVRIGEEARQKVGDGSADQHGRSGFDAAALELERFRDQARQGEGDRMEAQRLQRRTAEQAHAAQRGGVADPVREGVVHLFGHAREGGGMAEELVEEEGAGAARVHDAVDERRVCGGHDAGMVEPLSSRVGRHQHRVDQIRSPIGGRRRGAVRGNDAVQEALEARFRGAVGGQVEEELRAKRHPGADQRLGERRDVVEMLADLRTRHGVRRLLDDQPLHGLEAALRGAGRPPANDALADGEHLGNRGRDRFAREAGLQLLAQLLMGAAVERREIVARPELARHLAKELAVAEDAIAVLREEVVALRAGEDGQLAPGGAQAEDGAVALVVADQDRAGVTQQLEGAAEKRQTAGERRPAIRWRRESARIELHIDLPPGGCARDAVMRLTTISRSVGTLDSAYSPEPLSPSRRTAGRPAAPQIAAVV